MDESRRSLYVLLTIHALRSHLYTVGPELSYIPASELLLLVSKCIQDYEDAHHYPRQNEALDIEQLRSLVASTGLKRLLSFETDDQVSLERWIQNFKTVVPEIVAECSMNYSDVLLRELDELKSRYLREVAAESAHAGEADAVIIEATKADAMRIEPVKDETDDRTSERDQHSEKEHGSESLAIEPTEKNEDEVSSDQAGPKAPQGQDQEQDEEEHQGQQQYEEMKSGYAGEGNAGEEHAGEEHAGEEHGQQGHAHGPEEEEGREAQDQGQETPMNLKNEPQESVSHVSDPALKEAAELVLEEAEAKAETKVETKTDSKAETKAETKAEASKETPQDNVAAPIQGDAEKETRKRPKSPFTSAQKRKRFQNIAVNLVKTIEEHRYSSPFLTAVSAKNYRDVIYEPKDLKSILKNIKHKDLLKSYATVKELERDIMLMFANCVMFNKSSMPLVGMAQEMKDDVRETFKMFEEAELQMRWR